jgi:DNA repair exonuclease SbcCD nuclease subunit
MKALIIPDFHYGRYSNKSVEEGLQSVMAQILETVQKRNIKKVFFVGDLVRKKDLDRMDLQILTELNIFLECLTEFVMVSAISGNHDQYKDNFFNKNSEDFCTSGSVLDLLRSVSKFNNNRCVIGKETFLGIPFYRDGQDFIRAIDLHLDSNPTILICHQTPEGSGYESSDMVDFNLPIFKQFKKIYCGHIHEPKEFDNVIQTGAILAFKRNEQSTKYLYLFDTETGENTNIEIEYKVSHDFTPVLQKDTSISNSIKIKETVFDIKEGITNYSQKAKDLNKAEVLQFGMGMFNKIIPPKNTL